MRIGLASITFVGGASSKSSEPQWLKIAHALLLHGERKLPQYKFWPLAVSQKTGRAPSKNTASEAVDTMNAAGRFLAKRPLRFGIGMGLVVSVALGTESIRVALVDANGWIPRTPDGSWYVEEAEPDPQQLQLDPDSLLDRIAGSVGALLERAIDDPAMTNGGAIPLLGVAVAWPTPLHAIAKQPKGRALSHDGWREGDEGVHDRIAKHLGVPEGRSHALNDANAMALATAFDESRRHHEPESARRGGTMLTLRLAGGIGAGTVVTPLPSEPLTKSQFLQARLIEGTDGLAGELGHFQIDKAIVDEINGAPSDGLAEIVRVPCSCGQQGCLESYAGGNAFVERMRASSIGAQNGRMTVTSVMNQVLTGQDDGRRYKALEDIGRLIGRSLAAPILMLNPQSITLAGALAVAPVKEGVLLEKERWRHVHRSDIDLRLVDGPQGQYLACRGAALAVFRGQLYRRFDELGETAALGWELTIPFGRAEISALKRVGRAGLEPATKRL